MSVTTSGDDGEDVRSPALSDDALALQFTKKHRDELLYVAKWGRWLFWTGAYWRAEETYLAFDLSRAICRVAAANPKTTKKEAKDCTSSKTVAAVERLAKADRRHAAVADQWDNNQWSLNTPAGIVDLHNGAIKPHDQSAFCTKITSSTPDGECPG